MIKHEDKITAILTKYFSNTFWEEFSINTLITGCKNYNFLVIS